MEAAPAAAPAAAETRLERLLQLLAAGSSPAARALAAQQLGQVQRAQPDGLAHLLRRLHRLLRSSSWDTRQAAGRAVEAVAAEVEGWAKGGGGGDAMEVGDGGAPTAAFATGDAVKARWSGQSKWYDGAVTAVNGGQQTASIGYRDGDSESGVAFKLIKLVKTAEAGGDRGRAERERELLRFCSFDLENVIDNGATLLASTGAEYDCGLGGELGAAESAALQRKHLKEQLGLGGGQADVASGGMDDGVITDHDLGPGAAAAGSGAAPNPKKRSAAEMIAEIEGNASLSSREKNQAKRQAKQQAHAALVARDAPAELDDAEGGSSEPEPWPFCTFCERLRDDLLDPSWEVRHGAGVGLRALLRHHSASVGARAEDGREAQRLQNRQFSEDLALRLCCVLALDRFGDYTSTAVVAPVRETCSQALGTLARHLGERTVTTLLGAVLRLQQRKEWHVRNASMLGLRYILMARPDLVDQLAKVILQAVTAGLQDEDDDVRSSAAEAMLQVCGSARLQQTAGFAQVVALCWESLQKADDMSASLRSVIMLLAQLFSKELPRALLGGLSGMVPRLFPFLRHALSEVRLASVRTLSRLVAVSQQQDPASLDSIAVDLMSLLFKNVLLERDSSVVQESAAAWRKMLEAASAEQLLALANAKCAEFAQLLATVPGGSIRLEGFPVVRANTIGPEDMAQDKPPARKAAKKPRKAAARAKAGKKASQPAAAPQALGNVSAVQDADASMREEDEPAASLRLAGGRLLGALLARLPESGSASALAGLRQMMQSAYGYQRHVAALVIGSWASENQQGALGSLLESDGAWVLGMCNPLPKDRQGEAVIYREFARLEATLQTDMAQLKDELAAAASAKLSKGLGRAIRQAGEAATGAEQALQLGTSVFDEWAPQILAGMTTKAAKKWRPRLELAKETLLVSIGHSQTVTAQLAVSIRAAAAGCLLSMGKLPPKLTPVIKALLAAAKHEQSAPLQQHACTQLAAVAIFCGRHGKESACAQVVKNICKLVVAAPAAEDQSLASAETRVRLRGASAFLTSTCDALGDNLAQVAPALWQTTRNALSAFQAQCDHEDAIARLGEQAATSMRVLAIVLDSLHSSYHGAALELVPAVMACLRKGDSATLQPACQYLTALVTSSIPRAVECTLDALIPTLSNGSDPDARLGTIRALEALLFTLDVQVLPFILLLIVPTMGCMSDSCEAVRAVGTHCFGLLVKLMPLAESLPDPPALSAELVQKRDKERLFVQQLTGVRQPDAYQLPFEVGVKLRGYQQEGVDWLAFLNKFNLHGILCDDMGLGKTLQTLCVIGGDHHARSQCYSKSKEAEWQPLPSLVVCPPTLVGHWFDEVNKFVSSALVPLRYEGSPAERKSLRGKIPKHSIVLASYNTIARDAAELGVFRWNYCVLDEGHVIRNSKTQVAKAVKTLRSNHRLILTGTPIQNHAKELWSLFDFLMPGFLGGERSFNRLYAKDIHATSKAKSSKAVQRDSDRSSLAMERLHRQVLPFVLMRKKSEVLHDLPDKIIQDYVCDASPLQEQLLQLFTETQSTAFAGANSGKAVSGKWHVFQCLQYLRKLAVHPSLVLKEGHPKFDELSASLRKSGSSVCSLEHGSKFVALRQLLLDCGIGTEQEEEQAESAASAHRVLLFAQTKGVLDIIEQQLFPAMRGVTHLRLDGSVPAQKRCGLVSRFNSDPTIDVLLLTTSVGGLGLNLTSADMVIFMEHDWNPAKDLQAMDRAHRLGQTRRVSVYRLITRNTVEEKIMNLQSFKRKLANTVVSADNGSLATMGAGHMMELFELSPPTQDGGGAAAAAAEEPSHGGDYAEEFAEFQAAMDASV